MVGIVASGCGSKRTAASSRRATPPILRIVRPRGTELASFVRLSTATFPNPGIVPRDIVYLARARGHADQWINRGLLQLDGPAVLAKVNFKQFDVLGVFYIGDYPNLTINSIRSVLASKSQRVSSLTVSIALSLVGPPSQRNKPASVFNGAYGLAAVPKAAIGPQPVQLRVETQGPTCSPTFLPSCQSSG